MKGLPIVLAKTILLSVIVAVAANCIYYAVITDSGQRDYRQAVPLIMEQTFFQGIIIAVMSLPMLFLYHPNYWNNLIGRLLLYFAGPIMFIIAIFFTSTNPVSKTANLLTGAVFIIVNAIFYYTLTRKNKSGTTYSTRK